MALREPLARRVGDQVRVIEARRTPTQRLINQQLPKCGEKQIRAAHDFRDRHPRVIRNYRQLISRHVVFSPDNEIAEIVAGDGALCSKALIGELQCFRIRHAKAPVVPRGRIELADCFPFRPAGSWIDRLFIFVVRRSGGLKNIPPGTGAGINQRRVAQFFPRGEIDLAPLTLDVRRKRSANVRSFIPSQSKPAKVFGDGVPEFRPASILIQVLDPENKRSASLAGALLRAPERDCVAGVQITRRRWRDAAAVGNFRFQIADFRLA